MGLPNGSAKTAKTLEIAFILGRCCGTASPAPTVWCQSPTLERWLKPIHTAAAAVRMAQLCGPLPPVQTWTEFRARDCALPQWVREQMGDLPSWSPAGLSKINTLIIIYIYYEKTHWYYSITSLQQYKFPLKLFSFILHLSILMTNFTNILIFIAHPTESFKSKQEGNPRKKETWKIFFS